MKKDIKNHIKRRIIDEININNLNDVLLSIYMQKYPERYKIYLNISRKIEIIKDIL